jgi:hypothetical protein
MTAFLVKASASILRQCLNEETIAKQKSFPARLLPCMCFEANDSNEEVLRDDVMRGRFTVPR